MRRPTILQRKMNELGIWDLEENDIVEFPENYEQYHYGIIHGGFGCSTATIGTKIYATFGSTVEEAIRNEKEFRNIHDYDKDYRGYTTRQMYKIVGKFEP